VADFVCRSVLLCKSRVVVGGIILQFFNDKPETIFLYHIHILYVNILSYRYYFYGDFSLPFNKLSVQAFDFFTRDPQLL